MKQVFATVSALLVVLATSTTVVSAADDLDALIDSLNDEIVASSTVPPVVTQDACVQGQRCVLNYLCSNASTTGEGIIDERFGIVNLCGDNRLMCCYEEDIIHIPPTSPPKPTTPSPTTPAPSTPVPATPTPTPPITPTPTTPVVPPVQEPVCGKRNMDGIAHRIAGSNETEYGEFPWMMAVLKQEAGSFVYRCGGSLIHPRVVLTGAHCVQRRSPAQLKVRGGEWDTQSENEFYPHQDRNVAEIIVHPEYYKAGLHNDVALLIMDTPFELNQVIQTVCLPPQDAKFDHQRCFVSGWGKDEFGKEGSLQAILKQIDVPIVPSDQCQMSLRTTPAGPRFVLHNSFICAGGEKGKDTCDGDGGSPLVCPIPGSNEHYYQVGLDAWGLGCGDNEIPELYADVAHFRNWIDGQMQARQIDTGSYTP